MLSLCSFFFHALQVGSATVGIDRPSEQVSAGRISHRRILAVPCFTFSALRESDNLFRSVLWRRAVGRDLCSVRPSLDLCCTVATGRCRSRDLRRARSNAERPPSARK